MTKFKIGDRVFFLVNDDKLKGRIIGLYPVPIAERTYLALKLDEPWNGYDFHIVPEVMCKKLVKKKRREWWINERMMKNETLYNINFNWVSMFQSEEGRIISTTKPKNTDGWICVREVKK